MTTRRFGTERADHHSTQTSFTTNILNMCRVGQHVISTFHARDLDLCLSTRNVSVAFSVKVDVLFSKAQSGARQVTKLFYF